MDDNEHKALNRIPLIINNLRSSYECRPEYWRDVSESDWNSYRWQWNHRLLSASEIQKVLGLTDEEYNATEGVKDIFSVAVSPHYASLIDHDLGQSCPIRMQCIPNAREFEEHSDLLKDPLGELRHAISQCATRRYPDRALIYSTHECAMRCRHCTRRARVGLMEAVSRSKLEEALTRIKSEEQIRDVLISGGDPLSLSNSTLSWLISSLRECSHIDVIRLCTRMPCTLPQRIFDEELLEILRKNAPIYLNTQFNHPNEASRESAKALKCLRECGCILGNQSVLLKGINDRGEILEPLYRWLLKEGCRPYYLFLCDVAQGTDHFRTPIESGLAVMRHLRGRLSGLGIPHFVIDLPDGYGKVDLCPANPIQIEGSDLIFRNWYGAEVHYHDIAPS